MGRDCHFGAGPLARSGAIRAKTLSIAASQAPKAFCAIRVETRSSVIPPGVVTPRTISSSGSAACSSTSALPRNVSATNRWAVLGGRPWAMYQSARGRRYPLDQHLEATFKQRLICWAKQFSNVIGTSVPCSRPQRRYAKKPFCGTSLLSCAMGGNSHNCGTGLRKQHLDLLARLRHEAMIYSKGLVPLGRAA